MAKTQKELAFLRDLYIQDDWTKRFTDLVDKHMDLSDSDNMLYLNAGTGGHALAICERFGEKTDVFATCENEHLLAIANDKAAAVGASVDFSMIQFEDDAFDAVLGDASLAAPAEVESLIEALISKARMGGDVAIFLPSAGSYGEVFSLLWEALFNQGLSDNTIVEELIAELPTISRMEEIANSAGLVNINTQQSLEQFEYETSEDFVTAPLIADFLMPKWLESLEDEEKERVQNELTQLIDVDDDVLTFRFSIKATLLTGERG